MKVQVTLLCKYDILPGEEFPHVYGDWADAGQATIVRKSGDLSRDLFTGVRQARTVTTEGLQGPVDGDLLVAPPKYPPLRGETNHCDSTVVLDINSDARFMVLAVDDDGEGIPAWAEGRGIKDPISEDLWAELSTKIEAVTRSEVGDDQADQVATLMTNWRTQNPEGTPEQWLLALKRFTR